jgi:hypothetical protein
MKTAAIIPNKTTNTAVVVPTRPIESPVGLVEGVGVTQSSVVKLPDATTALPNSLLACILMVYVVPQGIAGMGIATGLGKGGSNVWPAAGQLVQETLY